MVEVLINIVTCSFIHIRITRSSFCLTRFKRTFYILKCIEKPCKSISFAEAICSAICPFFWPLKRRKTTLRPFDRKFEARIYLVSFIIR